MEHLPQAFDEESCIMEVATFDQRILGGYVMKKYMEELEVQIVEVACNCCGNSLKVENGLLKEGCFPADVRFGYFSSRDGRRHQFDLCEKCYDKIIAGFVIPVDESEETELL